MSHNGLSMLNSSTLPNPGREISAVKSSRQSLKTRLNQGEKLHGIMLFSMSPTLAEIASLAGNDFVMVDLEHGPGDFTDALHCVRAIHAAGSSCVIRIPENTAACAKKALDLGPDGIMFTKIETAKAASEAVSFCMYPPHGIRGCAYTRVRDSRYGFNKSYLDQYSEDCLIMCQVETLEGVNNIRDIIAVDGVDCVTTGPKDLSASLGLLHDVKDPRVTMVLRRLEKEVLDSDPAVFLAGVSTSHDTAAMLKKRGYHMVFGGSDLALFTKAAIDDVNAFKAVCFN